MKKRIKQFSIRKWTEKNDSRRVKIAQLQKDLGTLESTAKKKKWFW